MSLGFRKIRTGVCFILNFLCISNYSKFERPNLEIYMKYMEFLETNYENVPMSEEKNTLTSS